MKKVTLTLISTTNYREDRYHDIEPTGDVFTKVVAEGWNADVGRAAACDDVRGRSHQLSEYFEADAFELDPGDDIDVLVDLDDFWNWGTFEFKGKTYIADDRGSSYQFGRVFSDEFEYFDRFLSDDEGEYDGDEMYNMFDDCYRHADIIYKGTTDEDGKVSTPFGEFDSGEKYKIALFLNTKPTKTVKFRHKVYFI